jgi:4-hydroxy-2-oxoheptanedioate aldolase
MTTVKGFSLARQLRAGETVYSGWCGLASPLLAEVIGREGFPAVTIDMQHGLWDITQTVGAIAAIRQGGAAPVVRVPLGDFASASRALDFGAEGIISPMINTPADARAFVAATKYPASAAGGRTAPPCWPSSRTRRSISPRATRSPSRSP